jgi:cysteine desulfurase / selenocysteine lyase
VRNKLTLENARQYITGVDEQVTLLSGSRRTYINFDNASSTPTLQPVLDRINQFMPFYASVGRGSGYKSHIATEEFESARITIGAFVGARPQSHSVILGKNTTEALNKLANRFPFSEDGIVLTSLMEHHSNDLPWRKAAEVKFIQVHEDGTIDLEHLKTLLREYGRRVELVAITGASNVTGTVNPIHAIARMVHDVGARIVVDAAQLAPHRAIDMGSPDDPEHIDCLAYTGHKMYAPFGVGALVTLRDCLRDDAPDVVGGGTVDFVTERDVFWSGLPNREEAGTPNIVGAIAWAEAIRCLQDIGLDAIAEHESSLAVRFLQGIDGIDGVRVYGLSDIAKASEYLGVITFAIDGFHHKLVSAILGYEGGIGVRSGLFCAHPYLLRLQQITEAQQAEIAEALAVNGVSTLPGLVRASFGIYNTESEIDSFVDVVKLIVAKDTYGEYKADPVSGDYQPVGYSWAKLGTDFPPQPGC